LGQSLTKLIDPLVVGKGIPAPRRLKGRLVVETGRIVDALFNVGLEVPQQALDGPGGGIAQGANGLALDLAGNLFEHGDFALVGVALFQRRVGR